MHVRQVGGTEIAERLDRPHAGALQRVPGPQAEPDLLKLHRGLL
jgi:hypothetical protein